MDDDWCCQKFIYDKLVIKVNAIDTKIPSTCRLVTKKRNGLGKQVLQKKIEDDGKKIPRTSWMVKKTNYNTKITEIKKNG